MQPDLTQLQPAEFLRRYGWLLLTILVLGGTGVLLLSQADLEGVLWLAILGVFLGAEWMHSRTGSYLSHADSTALRGVIQGQPAGRPLLDRDTDDVLWLERRRKLWMRWWRVTRFSEATRITEEVESDFADGQVSTIPATVFLVYRDHIAAVDEAWPVRVGDGGAPEPFEPPGGRSPLSSFWFAARTSALKVSREDVAALAAQIQRAEPIEPEPDDEHAAA